MKRRFATYLGTRSRMDEYLSNGLVINSRIRSFLRGEVLVSQLGMGTFRLHPSLKEHALTLKVALQSGINLIDTSSTYTYGGAEELIGTTLQELGGESIRNQYVLVTKAGYIQDVSYRNRSNVIKSSYSSPLFDRGMGLRRAVGNE